MHHTIAVSAWPNDLPKPSPQLRISNCIRALSSNNLHRASSKKVTPHNVKYKHVLSKEYFAQSDDRPNTCEPAKNCVNCDLPRAEKKKKEKE